MLKLLLFLMIVQSATQRLNTSSHTIYKFSFNISLIHKICWLGKSLKVYDYWHTLWEYVKKMKSVAIFKKSEVFILPFNNLDQCKGGKEAIQRKKGQ